MIETVVGDENHVSVQTSMSCDKVYFKDIKSVFGVDCMSFVTAGTEEFKTCYQLLSTVATAAIVLVQQLIYDAAWHYCYSRAGSRGRQAFQLPRAQWGWRSV